MKIQKISPFLWYDGKAEEAANYYVSLFKNSKVVQATPMVTTFELEGQQFMAINGGPQFKFTEAVSFMIHCETQEEVDHFWNSFVKDGGSESQCGWCKDKYGLWWQVIPNQLMQVMGGTDKEKAGRAMQAMLKMKKIIIKDLENA